MEFPTNETYCIFLGRRGDGFELVPVFLEVLSRLAFPLVVLIPLLFTERTGENKKSARNLQAVGDTYRGVTFECLFSFPDFRAVDGGISSENSAGILAAVFESNGFKGFVF